MSTFSHYSSILVAAILRLGTYRSNASASVNNEHLMCEKAHTEGKTRAGRQSALTLTWSNMGSLWSKVVFLLFFIYFAYEVGKSVIKFQLQGNDSFIDLTESVS